MFANPDFTRKNAPVFLDSCNYAEGGPGINSTGMRIHIMNDGDIPPKALIEFDIFLIPLEDLEKGEKWKKTFYDLAGCICLTPEDTMKVIRHLNYLLSELFNDHNYLQRR